MSTLSTFFCILFFIINNWSVNPIYLKTMNIILYSRQVLLTYQSQGWFVDELIIKEIQELITLLDPILFPQFKIWRFWKKDV